MAGGVPQDVTDPKTIRAVFEALRDITVLCEWPISGHTDDYLDYYFHMTDGRAVFGFEFSPYYDDALTELANEIMGSITTYTPTFGSVVITGSGINVRAGDSTGYP